MKKTIVVIESNQPAMKEILSQLEADYTVISIVNPAIFTDIDFSSGDLFIVALHSNKNEGINACHYLKRNLQTRHKPLLIICLNSDSKNLIAKVDADGFIDNSSIKKDTLFKVWRCLQTKKYPRKQNYKRPRESDVSFFYEGDIGDI